MYCILLNSIVWQWRPLSTPIITPQTDSKIQREPWGVWLPREQRQSKMSRKCLSVLYLYLCISLIDISINETNVATNIEPGLSCWTHRSGWNQRKIYRCHQAGNRLCGLQHTGLFLRHCGRFPLVLTELYLPKLTRFSHPFFCRLVADYHARR